MAVLTGKAAHSIPILDPVATLSRRLNAVAMILMKAIGTAAVVAITGAWVTFLIRSAIWIFASF
jgi:hypothetical protein